MNKKDWVLPLLLLLMVIGACKAQDSYTLKQAIDYGMKNNRSVSIYENNKEKAQLKEKEAVAGFLPQVNGTATVDDNLKRQVSIIPAGVFSPVDLKVQFGTQYASNAMVQIDQTIFDQSVLLGIKAAKPNQALAEFNYQQNEQSLIYNISYRYYQVYVLEQNLNLLKQNQAKLEQLLKITELQSKQGVIKKIDNDRIKVSLSNVISQITIAQQNLELARFQLKNVMGFPVEQNIVLADSLTLDANFNKNLNVSAFNVSSRVEYKIQKTQIDLYNLEMKRIRGGALPKLSAYGRYGVQALGNDFGKSLNNKFDYSAVGLKLNVNLFDGLRRNSQYKQASIDWKNAEHTLYMNERAYQLEHMNATNLVNSSSILLETNERNLELANEVFQTTTLQYQQGVTSMSDFLNSETAYKEARINYINALLNFYLAQLELERADGTLKEFASSLN